MGAKAEKLVALALSRVVARNMAAGRSVEYQQLLLETEAEVGVLFGRRLERDARLLRRAQEKIREAQAQLAAAAQSRAVSPDDVEREFRILDMALGPPSSPPSWHPEHPENDF